MTIDPTKHRPVFDPGGSKPVVKSSDRTPLRPTQRNGDLAPNPFLVGLGPADVDDYPLADPFDVRAIDCR